MRLAGLDRFRTPEPWKAFNAREALGVNTWDLYNYVVGAYGGRIESIVQYRRRRCAEQRPESDREPFQARGAI